MRNATIFIAFCLIVWLISGCTTPPKSSDPATIALTPVDLFEGDKAKFKPFLGNLAGAFKLRYDGDAKVRLAVEVWENGQKKNTGWSVEDLFYTHNESPDIREIEVIVAMETTFDDEGRKARHTVKVGTFHENGSGLSTSTLEEEAMMAFGQLAYNEPQTFIAENAVHVFGIQGSRSGIIRAASLTPEDLSQIEWGVIFTLYFN